MSAHAMTEVVLAASGNTVAALAVKATLAMLAAVVCVRLARTASASLRHLVLAAAFGVLLLLPLAAMVVPPRVVPVASPRAAAVQGTERLGAVPAARVDGGVVGPAAPATPRGWLRDVGALDVAYAVYLLGLAWLGASLVVGIVRLHRMHRGSDVSVAATRLANEMARDAGLPGGIEVAVSPDLAVPITFGVGHPVILLPAETAEWSDAERRRALRHELEHVARGDWATHLAARAALALYWPHPLAWVLWRRLRLEAERACDDAVLRSQGQAEPYAEQLVSLARRVRGHGEVPALSMATRTNLGLRVDAILDQGQRRSPRSRLACLAATVAALAGLLAIAPVQVVGAAPAALVDSPRDEAAAHDDDDLDKDDDDNDPVDLALLEAAETGNLKKMQLMMERGAKADAVLAGDGTPLIAASRAGRLEAMKILLAAGADVNRGVDGDGNALIMAAKGGHLDAVRLLVDHGADVDRGVAGDGNALIAAAAEGHLDVVRYLVDRGASLEKIVPGDENPLIGAAAEGRAAVVRFLLERGANVNARAWADSPDRGRGEWRTPLLMARRNGHTEVERILLAAGAKE
jgi:bla regulator protein blaR1